MAFLIQKICLLLITILLLNICFLPSQTTFMPKPLLGLDILNNRKHYPSPRVCITIIIRSQKLLPRWGRIARNTPDDRSPAHTESAAFHQLLSAKVEYKVPSKISCSVSMDANDRPASFNYTESVQPRFLWDTCQEDQLWHPASLSKFCFPKRLRLNEHYNTRKRLHWNY